MDGEEVVECGRSSEDPYLHLHCGELVLGALSWDPAAVEVLVLSQSSLQVQPLFAVLSGLVVQNLGLRQGLCAGVDPPSLSKMWSPGDWT